jgi:hypothetical protein
MKSGPSVEAIRAAELRVVQGKRLTREKLRRLKHSLRAKLSRPSTLAAVAVATGLVGRWLGRSRDVNRASSAKPCEGAAVKSGASVVLGIAARYLVPVLVDWFGRK